MKNFFCFIYTEKFFCNHFVKKQTRVESVYEML